MALPWEFHPVGIRAIFEGQARFCQLQYLSRAFNGSVDFNEFERNGMLNGIYKKRLIFFLKR